MKLTRHLTALLLFLFALGSASNAQAQAGAIVSDWPKQSVVVENGAPAMKFVSKDGSVAVLYLRKHGDEDSIALAVVDWDTLKFRPGWMYFTASRIVFESDDSKDRSFDISNTEARLKLHMGRQRCFTIKVSGKEKRFLVAFIPKLNEPYGKHQDPALAVINRLPGDFNSVVVELRQEAAKLTGKPDELVTAKTASDLGTQPRDQAAKAFIEITSEPSGAEIYVDGAFSGSTPSRLSLTAAEHVIQVLRPGFKEWERRILVDSPSVKTVNAILEKQPPGQ